MLVRTVWQTCNQVIEVYEVPMLMGEMYYNYTNVES